MSYTKISNHADQAVERLHSKHKGKANIEALLRILTNPIQDIEDTLWQLWTERLIDTAVGEQLNVLGRVVGQPRNGLEDDEYRRYIRARIAANKSKGRWSDLIIVARLIINEPTASLIMSDSDYRSILMEITGYIVSDALASTIIQFLRTTKSDVDRVLLTYTSQDISDTYTLGSYTELSAGVGINPTTLPVDSTEGFEDAGDLIVDTGGPGLDTASYTSKDDTNFYGVTGLTSSYTSGTRVQTGNSTTQGLEDDTAPGTGGKFAGVTVGGPPPGWLWSGTFDNFATDNASLEEFLGLSAGFGDGSHIWEPTTAILATDVGSLATTDYNMVTDGTPPSITTDSAYGGGARTIMDQTADTERLIVSGTALLPNPADATKSFIAGGVMQWDSLPGAGTYTAIFARYYAAGTRGYIVFVDHTDVNDLKLQVQFIRGPGFTLTNLVSLGHIPLGTPFAWMINVDFAAGLVKIMTSADSSYVETAVLGSGTFDSAGSVLTVGNSGITGISPTFIGKWAQKFFYEYASTLDAEISEETMINFLQYSDGYQ